MHKENGDLTARAFITLIGGFLATIISLSVILSWKFDSAIGCKAEELRKEASEKYVPLKLYELQIATFSDKLDAVVKAVGAKIYLPEYPRP